MREYQRYEVAHGVGYSRFTHQVADIESVLTVFVAPDAPLEYFQLTLKNLSHERRELDITSYAEWLLGFAPDEHREFHKLFIETTADESHSSKRRLMNLGVLFSQPNVCGDLRTNADVTTMSIGLIPLSWPSASP